MKIETLTRSSVIETLVAYECNLLEDKYTKEKEIKIINKLNKMSNKKLGDAYWYATSSDYDQIVVIDDVK